MRLIICLLAGLCSVNAAFAQSPQPLNVSKIMGRSDGQVVFQPLDTSNVVAPAAAIPSPVPSKSQFSLFKAIAVSPFAWLFPPRPLPPVFGGPTGNGVTKTPAVNPNQSTYRAILRQGRREERREALLRNQLLSD